MFDPKFYVQKLDDNYIAEIPFDCIYAEASKVKVLAEAGKFYSPIYDLAGFRRAQESYVQLQTEALSANPHVKSKLGGAFLQSSQMSKQMEADPSLFYNYDDLIEIKPNSIDTFQNCLFIR